MGKKSAPSPPPAPDPNVAIQAQQKANLINQFTPYGSLEYTPIGDGRYSSRVTLSPQSQKQFDLEQQLGTETSNLALGQVGRLRNALADPVYFGWGDAPGTSSAAPPGRKRITGDDFSAFSNQHFGGVEGGTSVPGAENAGVNRGWWVPSDLLNSYGFQGPILEEGTSPGSPQSFNPINFPELPGSGSFSADRDAVTQALIARNKPLMDQRRNELETQLYNRGITSTSNPEAWKASIDDLTRQENDFSLSALQAGGSEQSRLFGLGQSARQQAIQEYMMQRNAPINEIGALLGTGGVQQPQFSQAPQVDALGPYNTQYQGQLAGFNAQNQARNSGLGGLYGLGGSIAGALPWSSWLGGTAAHSLGAAVFASDIRLKTDIHHIGYENTFPIYTFRYLDDPKRLVYRGIIAQDVLEIMPEAVGMANNGYYYVNYDMIGIEFGRIH